MQTKYRDYNCFYGKIWVILTLLVVIPVLLVFYLFFDGRIDLKATIILYVALILACFLAGLSLMRSSADKLANLAIEIGEIATGEKNEPVKINAEKEMNDIADNFNSVYIKFQDVNRVAREQSIQLILYAKDLSLYNEKLQTAYRDTINRLVVAAEYKDEDTGDHIIRMSRYCTLIAEKLGLSSTDVQSIKFATPMHDVGKIGIPDSILMKQGKLTDKEFEIIKTHTIIGSNILANSDADILQMAQKIALSHHEKWNGLGYPHGLSGERIDLVGRIVCLADTFDALISKRPYKDPYPLEVVCDIISKERGKYFDPSIVDIFLDNIDEIVIIKNEIGSSKNIALSDFIWSERDRLEDANRPTFP
ncbi:MAG: HD domain-containing protein [Candidatus Latescibacter sp.]|nr:HD domain-containing protein [Candidatus Latescibacter sp.]